jgi:lysophospholipase L1-like esterase
MKSWNRLVIGIIACVSSSLWVAADVAEPNLSPTRFEKDIQAFVNGDATNPPPRQAILFVGSSIFREWTQLPEQMAPLPVFNRAFGGSLTTDVLHYMDRIVLPYEPRIIVYYCGSNDVNVGRNADQIFAGFRKFAERVQVRLPHTRIFYVSINRAPQKKAQWSIVDSANAKVKHYCGTNAAVTFIDVNPALFDAAGEPRLDLYQPDQLHFREAAYAAFAEIVKPVLVREWKP